MALDNLIKKFEQMTADFLNRFEVNQLVCFSSEVEKGNLSKNELITALADKKYEKIEINRVLCLNALEELIQPSQEDENSVLHARTISYINFINDEIGKLCSQGEYKYELNELFRQKLKQIDQCIDQMDYLKWCKRRDILNDNEITFLVFKKGRLPFPKQYLDIETRRHSTVDVEFALRRNLLEQVKVELASVFSKHLFIPNIEIIPTIKYNEKDCTQTDICELVLALSESKYFVNSQEMKAILLAMFNIPSEEYTEAHNRIKKRKKGCNQFVQKFSDGFKIE